MTRLRSWTGDRGSRRIIKHLHSKVVPYIARSSTCSCPNVRVGREQQHGVQVAGDGGHCSYNCCCCWIQRSPHQPTAAQGIYNPQYDFKFVSKFCCVHNIVLGLMIMLAHVSVNYGSDTRSVSSGPGYMERMAQPQIKSVVE